MNKYLSKLQEKASQTVYQEQGISYLGLFGSAARGEEKSNSDIDVLIDFNTSKTLFDLADIQFYLETTLGRKVDLVAKNGLKKYIRKNILDSVVYV